MTKIFIPAAMSFDAIKEMILQIEKLDIIVDNTTIGSQFDDFAEQLTIGDTIIVPSLDFFPSLIELLTSISRLQERGITLRSIEEPWLNKPVANTADFLEKLRSLAVAMHASRTKQGLVRAKNRGKTLGRRKGQKNTTSITPTKLAEIELLRHEEHLTIAQACAKVGCSPNSYRTHYKGKVK